MSDILDAFDTQIAGCKLLGSPFTARVLQTVRDDIARGGRSYAVIEDWSGDPILGALALRFAGGLHHLVITNAAPDLAVLYPDRTPSPDETALAQEILSAVTTHTDDLKNFVENIVQTNEVHRSAVLLGGFLEIAARTHLPFRLLELGSSAGLNLIWDKYAYQIGDRQWGESEVTFKPKWKGNPPNLDLKPNIASRAGCDLNPVDVHDSAALQKLEAYIWPGQFERRERFRAACALARAHNVKIDRRSANDWLPEKLAHVPEGQATVIFHSIFWQYMPDDVQASVETAIRDAGAAATPDSPFAWLRLETPTGTGIPDLLLDFWPGDEHARLASCHPHGLEAHWKG